MGMGSTGTGESAGSNRRVEPTPRVVIVVGRPTREGEAYRVEAPDRVLRMFGMLTAARDELDLLSPPPASRARIQRLLEVVRAELERSVSDPLAEELRRLMCRSEAAPGAAAPGAADLRIEYASLLGWSSGLVVAMLDQLAALRDSAAVTGPSPAIHAGEERDGGMGGSHTGGSSSVPRWPWTTKLPRPETGGAWARLPSRSQSES